MIFDPVGGDAFDGRCVALRRFGRLLIVDPPGGRGVAKTNHLLVKDAEV
jgi:hypothetical protein